MGLELPFVPRVLSHKRARPEIGVFRCRLCDSDIPLFKGRQAGGLFANCGVCDARYHFPAGSRARELVAAEAGLKE